MISIIYSLEKLIMKIILHQALQKYRDRSSVDSQDLKKYIEHHRYYQKLMPIQDIISQFQAISAKQKDKKDKIKNKEIMIHQKMTQLSYYLKRENNKKIFILFEHILKNQKGITYQILSKELKTDIITISHYCCKLKKLRFIDLEHEKEGIIVYPKSDNKIDVEYSQWVEEQAFDIKASFMFHDLSMPENIWINISSKQSISKGGLTNEEIKRKIMKHSENKMVRRTVESMKNFQKIAERQGKVFQFKYRNQTQQIKVEMSKQQNNEQIDMQILVPSILEWLRQKFPQIEEENFLLKLVNEKFKDYISSIGVKQSKRQCTSLKLNRYIRTLNYLYNNGGMKENELRSLIVNDEQKYNIGIMHKRSLMGILEGLKSLNILVEQEGFYYYYPSWIDPSCRLKKQEERNHKNEKEEDQPNSKPRKRVHLDKSNKLKGDNIEKQIKYKRVTQSQYKLEVFILLLTTNIAASLKRIYKKAFKNIFYTERKKTISKFTPQKNLVFLLEQKTLSPDTNLPSNLQEFYHEVDQYVQQLGRKETFELQIQNEIMRFVRKNPQRSSEILRRKYGKNWQNKFVQLEQKKLIRIESSGIDLNQTYSGYFL